MDCGRGTTSLPAQMARKRQRQRGSGVEGSDDSDVELGGQTVPDDPTLLQFDLGLRPHRLNLEHQWAVEAKERATRIRFGAEHAIQWWDGRGLAANYPLERVRLNPWNLRRNAQKGERILHAWICDFRLPFVEMCRHRV